MREMVPGRLRFRNARKRANAVIVNARLMMSVESAIAPPMSKGFLTRWGSRTVAVALALALALVSVACSDQTDSHLTTPLMQARNIVVEIDAMPGALPSFAPLSVGGSPWLVLEHNLRALAPPSLEGLVYPRSAQDVGPLDAAGNEFSNQHILALADRHRRRNRQADALRRRSAASAAR